MDSRNPLLDLPTELVEWIAGHLQPPDLLSFRLTCRELSDRTLTVVANSLFRDRSFLISNQISMATLWHIACHPTFGQSMRSIRLSCARIPDTKLNFQLCNQAFPTESRQARQDRRDQRNAFFELQAKEARYIANYRYSKALTYILTKFRLVANCPTLHATETYLRYPQKPAGYRLMGSKLGYENAFVELPNPDPHIYHAIRKAITESHYPIQHLSIGWRENPVPFGIFRGCFNEICFRDLVTLSVTLRPDSGRRTGTPGRPALTDDHGEELVSFLATIVAAEKLENVTLAFESTLAFTPDRCVLNCLAVHSENEKVLPHLKKFCLRGFMLEPDLFFRFVRFRRSTLREIRLANVKDNVKNHPNMTERIVECLDDGQDVERTVELTDCWNGWKWLQDYLGYEIDEAFVRDVFGLDTGLDITGMDDE